ncbi:MAG: hypothetical protein ACLUD7_05900 [Lachnospiraceae bacterium]
MMILNLWGEIRELCLRLDMVAFSFIDNIYSLFNAIASESLITNTVIKQVLNNVYVLVGIFAFFRIAMLLINSIINPDALNKQGAGLSKIFVNTVIMLVLLVFTPTLFQMSRDFASAVVSGNYVQKLFINVNDSENTLEPGKEMQRIAIGAVITKEDGITCGDGSGDCDKAVQCLNNINGVDPQGDKECVTKKGVAWGKLADYNGVREKVDGDKVYVYNYKLLVLTVVGWLITYVLLSFTFDVAKRMIELAVLEIVSPLFIATIVDPKSMQSGPFKKWLKTLGNSYASLFLRIAAISIMLLCVRLLSYWKPSAEVGAFGKLIILIAFLIFVKQLPKWFSNMLGMDGDGTGLGSLGIGKKIGGAALIGGAATTLGHGLSGGAAAAAGNAVAAARDNRINRKKNKNNADYLDKENGVGSKSGRKNIRDRAVQEAAAEGKGRFSQWKAGRKAVNAEKAKQNANYGQRLAGAMAIGAIEGGKVGAKAENLKGAFSAGKGVIGTKDGKSLGLQGKGIGSIIAGGLSDAYNLETDKIFGDSTVRRKQREERELEQKRSDFVNPQYRNSMIDNSNNGGYNLTAGLKQGDYNALAPELDKYGITGIDDVRDTLATLAMKPNCKITGFNATEHELSLSDGSTMKISGNAGKVLNDGGQANIEQMYLNRGNQVLSEREQYNNAISSIQSAINEAVSANASLRAFSVNMPDGGKIDLSFRSIDELSSKIAQSKSVVDAGAPNSQDYQRSDGTVDKEAFSRAQLNFQNNYAIYDSLTKNQSVIETNLGIAASNEETINDNKAKIEELRKAIKDNKMDEVVDSLASAVKVNNVNNIEGIKEGVSRETSKRAERIKDSKESGKKSE